MAYISFQPSDYFNTLLYTGNNTDDRAITGVGFQPDWTWIKLRNANQQHELFDAVRGANKPINSNTTNAENTEKNRLKSFDSDGFTLGTSTAVNKAYNYVAWNWKAGTTSGLSGGTITPSSYSISATSGVGIYKYTGTGSNGLIAHGLGVAPKVVLIKDLSATGSWRMYTEMTGNASQLALDQTSAADSGNTTMWNSTSPTTTTFSIGTHGNVNTSGNSYIAIAFAQKKGFSAMSSYKGNNNADGSYIHLGFRPAFFLWKRSSSSGGWYISDSKRDTFNEVDTVLSANDSGSESDQGSTFDHDFLSNGIKIRNTVASQNSDGDTFVYIAFAEHPLVSSNGVPATAR